MLNLENSKMTYGCARSRFSKKYLTSLLNLNIPGGPVLELFSRGVLEPPPHPNFALKSEGVRQEAGRAYIYIIYI